MLLPPFSKLALQLSQPALEQVLAFSTSVLAAQTVYQEPGLIACQLPDGQVLELYGPGANSPAVLFAHSPVLASFQVGDMARAVASARAVGLLVVNGPTQVSSQLALCYLQASDGLLLGLYERTSSTACPA